MAAFGTLDLLASMLIAQAKFLLTFRALSIKRHEESPTWKGKETMFDTGRTEELYELERDTVQLCCRTARKSSREKPQDRHSENGKKPSRVQATEAPSVRTP